VLEYIGLSARRTSESRRRINSQLHRHTDKRRLTLRLAKPIIGGREQLVTNLRNKRCSSSVISATMSHSMRTSWWRVSCQRERQRQRQRERERERERETERDRETERQRDTEREEETHRERETERQRQRQTESVCEWGREWVVGEWGSMRLCSTTQRKKKSKGREEQTNSNEPLKNEVPASIRLARHLVAGVKSSVVVAVCT
jgi:hypothetical protein